MKAGILKYYPLYISQKKRAEIYQNNYTDAVITAENNAALKEAAERKLRIWQVIGGIGVGAAVVLTVVLIFTGR